MRIRSVALVIFLAMIALQLGPRAGASHAGAKNGLVVNVQGTPGSAGTCAVFTVTVTLGSSNGPPAEGEIVDIFLSQSDADTNGDIRLAFCDPDGPGTDLSGPPPVPGSGQQTGSGGTPAADCDDDGSPPASPGASGDDCANPPGSGEEGPAAVQEECVTNANGECRFGVVTSEVGSVLVRSWFEGCTACNDDNVRGDGEPFDTENAAFSGPNDLAKSIVCFPTDETHSSGDSHVWECTVTDAGGAGIPDVLVMFDVITGPNNEEVGPSECAGLTDTEGRVSCGYLDDFLGPAESPPGTDTIVVWVNLSDQVPPTFPPRTAGPDLGEPQTTITTTWLPPPENIACTPTGATNPSGSSHVWQCTLTDANGNGTPGELVMFDVVTGPNTEEVDLSGCASRTNDEGQVSCGYEDDRLGPANSPPGTDTILVWVNRRNPGNALEFEEGDLSLTITKSWAAAPPDPYFTAG